MMGRERFVVTLSSSACVECGEPGDVLGCRAINGLAQLAVVCEACRTAVLDDDDEQVGFVSLEPVPTEGPAR